MIVHYFIGVLFTLAAVAVFAPLYVALHFSHEDEKQRLHRNHLRDSLRLSRLPSHDVEAVDITCSDCGSHALTVDPRMTTAA